MSEKVVTGSSFDSFEDAALKAFESVPGNPAMEGMVTATVQRLWVQKGGIVGTTQFGADLSFDEFIDGEITRED